MSQLQLEDIVVGILAEHGRGRSRNTSAPFWILYYYEIYVRRVIMLMRVDSEQKSRRALLWAEQIVLYSVEIGVEKALCVGYCPHKPRYGGGGNSGSAAADTDCELTDDSFMNSTFTFKLKVRIWTSRDWKNLLF